MADMKDSAQQGFSARVRARRKSLHLRQGALAQLIGRDQTYISHLERATINPNLETLLRLATALDVEIMLVPREKVIDVERLLGRPEPSSRPETSVFDDVFVEDPEDGDGHEI
jgi:HTH-type transcriptional regulator/antitoxin HipB